MKSLFIIIVIFSCSHLLAQQNSEFTERAKITVTGEAVVKVVPDKIIILLRIETLDKDIIIAKSKNNEILKKTVDSIRKFGVKDKDIQTDYLSIHPRYENDRMKILIGYSVNNTIAVTLNKVDQIENIITNSLLSGVNHINNIEFQTSEFMKYREEARRLALEAAREKAKKMAAVFGQNIDLPIQIIEEKTTKERQGYSMSQNVIRNVEGQNADIYDTIALSKISIRAKVKVTFEIKG